MKTPLALLIAAAATLGGLFMASTSAARADDLGYFQQQVDPYLQKPKFVASGPAFDASACMKGKTILSIPVSSANPFTANIEKAMVAVAKQVGFTFIDWQNQGQSSQWVQGMNAGINQKVDLIDLLAGADPRVLVPQIGAARAAHIPVVASHYAGMEQTPTVLKYADGDVPIDYAKAGALLADWAIMNTKGHMDALVLIATGPLSTDSMLNGINGELKHCSDCTTKVMNFVVTDWGTRITPAVQAALLSDPKINYIIVIYDSMSQFVVPAVTITGSSKRVKIDAFNGTPFVLGPGADRRGADGYRREPRLDRARHPGFRDAPRLRAAARPQPRDSVLHLHPGECEGCRHAAEAQRGLWQRLCRRLRHAVEDALTTAGAEAAPLALHLTDLSKTFGGQKALDQVSLEVRPREVHGLLGQNGSGKSTLIKVLAGFHPPDAGSRLAICGDRGAAAPRSRRLPPLPHELRAPASGAHSGAHRGGKPPHRPSRG